MRLIWYKRQDGRWNADCTCHATLCGSSLELRKEFEDWHFERAEQDRNNGNKHHPCGPRMPEEDLNYPGSFEFP